MVLFLCLSSIFGVAMIFWHLEGVFKCSFSGTAADFTPTDTNLDVHDRPGHFLASLFHYSKPFSEAEAHGVGFMRICMRILPPETRTFTNPHQTNSCGFFSCPRCCSITGEIMLKSQRKCQENLSVQVSAMWGLNRRSKIVENAFMSVLEIKKCANYLHNMPSFLHYEDTFRFMCAY